MLSSIFTLALLSTSALAVEEKRQATSGEQFTAAADQLISAYIPSSAVPIWEAAVSAGASLASVTGDAKSILHSALLATELPEWLASAVPTEYSSQLQALESGINNLRGTVGAPVIPVVVAVTTTNSAGETITSEMTTTAPIASATDAASQLTTQVVDGVTSIFPVVAGVGAPITSAVTTVVDGVTSVYSTVVSGGASVASVLTTQVVDGVTSVFTTAVSGASSVASDISSGGSSVLSEATSGGSSVLSEATSGASSVLSEATQGASSILSEASGAVNPTSTASAAGGNPTAIIGGAVGMLGLVGAMIAL